MTDLDLLELPGAFICGNCDRVVRHKPVEKEGQAFCSELCAEEALGSAERSGEH